MQNINTTYCTRIQTHIYVTNVAAGWFCSDTESRLSLETLQKRAEKRRSSTQTSRHRAGPQSTRPSYGVHLSNSSGTTSGAQNNGGVEQ